MNPDSAAIQSTPHVTRTQVSPDDLDWLLPAAAAWLGTLRWNFGYRSPSPDRVRSAVWDRTVWQSVIKIDGDPAALLQIGPEDLTSGHANLEFLVAQAQPLLAHEMSAFIAEAFKRFPYRKLYVYSLATIEPVVMDLLPDHRRIEGVLTDHELMHAGVYSDLMISSILRSAS